MSQQEIAKSAAINLTSRLSLGILGFLQIVLIARAFGINAATDAYMIATWVVILVWGMGDSVLVYSLVPYLVSLRIRNGVQTTKETINHIFSCFFLLLLASAFLIYLFSPYLIYILAPGFSDEARLQTVELLRWLSPMVFVGGLAAFSSSLLFVVRRFGVPAATAVLPEIGVIGFILFGADLWGIKAAVFGFIIGISIQFSILTITLLSLGMLPRFRWPRIDSFLEVFKQMGPRIGGVIINRAIVGVDRFFASMLRAGSVSVLAYSYKVAQQPFSLAVAVVGKTLMPILAEEVAKGEMERLRKFIPRSIAYVFFGLAPLVLLLVYYSEPLIRLLFQRGNFNPEATSLAASLLVFFSLAILFSSITAILAGIFYAAGDTWTPFKVSSFCLVLNVVLDIVLMNVFGLAGIAMATMGVAITSMILLYRSLNTKIGRIEISLAFDSLVKIAIATAVMGLTIWAITGVLANYISLENFVVIGVLSFSSWIIFLLSCHLLKLEEFLTVELLLGRKFRWQR